MKKLFLFSMLLLTTISTNTFGMEEKKESSSSAKKDTCSYESTTTQLSSFINNVSEINNKPIDFPEEFDSIKIKIELSVFTMKPEDLLLFLEYILDSHSYLIEKDEDNFKVVKKTNSPETPQEKIWNESTEENIFGFLD